MKLLFTAALLCAPFTLAAAQFERETVQFDDDGRPVISAELMLPPITAREAAHTQVSDNQHAESRTQSAQATGMTSRAATTPVIYQHTHFIYPDETYFNAINRWLGREHYQGVAWSLDEEVMSKLNTAPAGTVSFAGTIGVVMSSLSRQLGVPFTFTEDRYQDLAALHQFHGRDVTIAQVKGHSIEAAISSLAEVYQWQWTAEQWLSPHDYPLQGDYPIVTPKGDIERALSTVLAGYPLDARLLSATRTLFITAQ